MSMPNNGSNVRINSIIQKVCRFKAKNYEVVVTFLERHLDESEVVFRIMQDWAYYTPQVISEVTLPKHLVRSIIDLSEQDFEAVSSTVIHTFYGLFRTQHYIVEPVEEFLKSWVFDNHSLAEQVIAIVRKYAEECSVDNYTIFDIQEGGS